MTFVADSGPIISFARAEHLWLLRRVVGELWIPEAVYKELVVKGAGKPGAEETAQGVWIKRRQVTQQELVRKLPRKLGAGEREAIVLAEELQVVLVVDEPWAQEEADRRGLPLLGSLGILREAKLRGIIPAVKPHLDALRAHHFRLKDSAYHGFLRMMGEES